MTTPNHGSRSAHAKATGFGGAWLALSVAGALAIIAAGIIWLAPMRLAHADAEVVVYKTASCGCCHDWVDHLRDEGLTVAVVNVRETQYTQRRLGIPAQLVFCNTAKTGDYFVEGHVPTDLIQRLLVEKPKDIRGIAVPGMPIGSPGIEGPNPVEYDVPSVNAQDAVEVFAIREGRPSPR